MLKQIKKMAIGQELTYRNCPFSSGLLLSAICENGRSYTVKHMPGMLSSSVLVTRTA